ncbi:MAG: hypothetical protein ACOYVJ_03730 [Nitrospirota bacterium]
MRYIRNEKGIALVMVLILALISLAIIATLTYLVIQGTKFSGFFKRYETAREAGIGGAEIIAALIANRGELDVPGVVSFPKMCDCGDPDVVGDSTFSDGTALTGSYICLCAKMCDPAYTGVTYNWGVCTNGTTLDPNDNPDIQLTLLSNPLDVASPSYDVTAKIVDVTRGNTDLSGLELGGTGVVASTAGVIPSPQLPYLYRIEVNSESSASILERSRLSVLYAY